AILAVAVDQGRYTLDVSPDAPVSDDVYARAAAATKDALSRDDWDGAAIAAAAGLRGVTPGSGSSSDGGGGSFLTVLLIGGLIVILLVLLVAWLSSRRHRDATTDGAPKIPTELNQRASSALVAIDDELRTAEQELGFAQAQFGNEAT